MIKNLSYFNFDNKLNPGFITGFVDAEGCFHVSIVDNTSLKVGKSVRAMFQISLHMKDKLLLDKINNFFGVGQVILRKDGVYYYQVSSLVEILIIIAHLEKYPLITQKRGDFELFKKIISLMSEKKHLTSNGLNEIANIKASMNFLVVSDSLQSKFPNIKPVPRPLVEKLKISDSN